MFTLRDDGQSLIRAHRRAATTPDGFERHHDVMCGRGSIVSYQDDERHIDPSARYLGSAYIN